MKRFLYILIALHVIVTHGQIQAAYLFKDGKFYDAKDVAYLTIDEHYNLGVEALKEKKWDEAIRQFRIVTISFPDAELANDANYFLGASYFAVDDLDLANQKLSLYLGKAANSKYFIQAFTYKFLIAERFQNGEKARLFHHEKLPKWQPATSDAIAIYDEIINTLSNHELAARALYNKGSIYVSERDFTQAIDAYHSIIKKFPKSDMALKSYVVIAKTYLDQCRYEIQNSDLLGLAEVNLKKLRLDFPKADEIDQVASCITEMKENYAASLYDTGRLYERKNQPKAAVIYYHTAIDKFPGTRQTLECQKRLQDLHAFVKEVGFTQNAH